MSDVRRADPATRRRSLLVVASGTVLGGLLIAGFEHFRDPLHEWLVSRPAETLNLAMSVVVMALLAPVIGLAIHLWLLGTRIVRSGEYPPPGQAVIRDTPVVRGSGASRRGRALQVFALFLGAVAVLSCLAVWWLVGEIVGGQRGKIAP